jgi:hypothetical protein
MGPKLCRLQSAQLTETAAEPLCGQLALVQCKSVPAEQKRSGPAVDRGGCSVAGPTGDCPQSPAKGQLIANLVKDHVPSPSLAPEEG